MPFIVLAVGVPMPDAPISHLSSSTHAPGALEQICRSPSQTHLGVTDSPAMPDTSLLGSQAWEMALNHQGLDIKSPV